MHKVLSAVLLAIAVPLVFGQAVDQRESDRADSDRDGLSDVLEDALLSQFTPQFFVGQQDCSILPAEFVPLAAKPIVQSDNGTIYGQAFPVPGHSGQVELHFYHLWRTDCGEMGHNLDAEHVSALVVGDDAGKWKALYWYAAAHEDTVCDRSQITRAVTIGAEDRGPRIWISRGKHASFLSDILCASGCGGDDCGKMQALAISALINVGEPSAAMNGASWVDDPHWPLATKMRRDDFTDVRLARLNQLSGTTIAWANPQKRSYQAAIRGSDNAMEGVSSGARATDAALDTANASTEHALGAASNSTGNGLTKTYRGVAKALRLTAKSVGKALSGNAGGKDAK